MDTHEVPMAELPEAVRAWLAEQPAIVILAERVGNDQVVLRTLPGVDPGIIARAQVTLATYREALMNLT